MDIAEEIKSFAQLDHALILGELRAENKAIRVDIADLRDDLRSIIDRLDDLNDRQAELYADRRLRSRNIATIVSLISASVGAALSAIWSALHTSR